jgi:lysyl-tRNA synthetase class 2
MAGTQAVRPDLAASWQVPALTVPGPAARRSWSVHAPRIAAVLVLLAGLLNLVSAFLPAERERLRLLDELVPGVVSDGATVVTAAAGVGLVLLSGGLRRRRRAAWLATIALLASSVVLNLTKGLDFEEAAVEGCLAALLLTQGGRFTARLGPRGRRALLEPAVGALVVTTGYGILGLVSGRHHVVGGVSPVVAVGEVARMALGLGTGLEIGGRFGRVFPTSVAAVFYVGALVVGTRALAPALVRRVLDPDLTAAVAASDDALAYFALRDDRATVRAGKALVAYGPVGTVALAAGDPLGPREHWPAVVRAFVQEAAAQGRIAAVLGCGAEAACAYAAAGFRVIYLGDEAVLHLDGFALDGRARRIARQSWNRARRAGFTAQVCRARELDPDSAAALRALSDGWRGHAAERGFSMALGRLFDPRDDETIVVTARDAAGRLRGFLHFVPWGADGASLDVMRRDRHAPSFLNDFLVVEAALRLPELGMRRVSLNFSFLRAILAAGAEPECPLRLRAARWLLRRLSGPFQIESLYRFNRKFAPAWCPRYVAVEAPEELPRLALAALKAEGLLAPPRRRAAGRATVAASAVFD